MCVFKVYVECSISFGELEEDSSSFTLSSCHS